MASKSDPDIPASSGSGTESTPRQSRRRTKSVPASPSSGQQDGSEGGAQMEQLQIAESPQHEAAGGHSQGSQADDRCVRCLVGTFCGTPGRRGFFACLALIAIFVGVIILIYVGGDDHDLGYRKFPSVGTVKKDAEWDSLWVDLVFPGDPHYIPGTGYNPDGSQYIQQLVAEYTWQSRACGMSFRNVKTEKPPTERVQQSSEGAPTEPPQEPSQAPPSDQHGGGNETGRLHLLGSQALKPGQFPWNLAMFTEPKEGGTLYPIPFCGATLISARYAVTANHCLPPFGRLEQSPYYYWVSGGAVRLDQLRELANQEHQMRLVKNVLFHRSWPVKVSEDGRIEAFNDGYDIGIISWYQDFKRLHTRDGLVVLSPICLPSSALIANYSLSYEGQHIYAGMGENGDPATNGLTDRVRVGGFQYNATCQEGWYPEGYYLNQCRDTPPQETGHCAGDSGGSVNTLVLDPDRKRYFLSGIISFGIPGGCAEVVLEGNVRVEPHLDHIDTYINSRTVLIKDIY